MMTQDEHEMPQALRAVGAVPLDLDGAGLRILAEFQPLAETEAWFSEAGSCDGVSARDFLVFAVDEEEGYDYVAIWLARAGAAITDQPVIAVGPYRRPELLAPDLDGFLWAIADAFTPMGADSPEGSTNYHLVDVATRFAPERRLTLTEAQATAQAAFPEFPSLFAGWVQQPWRS